MFTTLFLALTHGACLSLQPNCNTKVEKGGRSLSILTTHHLKRHPEIIEQIPLQQKNGMSMTNSPQKLFWGLVAEICTATNL